VRPRSTAASSNSRRKGSGIDLINDLEVGEDFLRREPFEFLFAQAVEPIKERPLVGTGLASLIAALNTDFDWLREHTRYLQRATEWDRGGRPANRLLSGNDSDKRRPSDHLSRTLFLAHAMQSIALRGFIAHNRETGHTRSRTADALRSRQSLRMPG
jgi:hypothetical protein